MPGNVGPPTPHELRWRMRWYGWAYLIATGLALFFGLQGFWYYRGRDISEGLWEYLIPYLATWWARALFAPAVFEVSRRFRIDGPRTGRALAGHLIGMLAVAFGATALNYAVFVCLMVISGWTESAMRVFGEASVTIWITLMLRVTVYYAVVAGGYYLIDYYQRLRQRELLAARLESQLHQARLQALRSQLRPHFLFNTLNAISTLIHEDPRAADRMVTMLADLLRQGLADSTKQLVPLGEELELVDTYLAIEKVRFGPRLQVSREVDPGTLELPVPHFLLQPLVENALRHGLAPRATPGTVWIGARVDDGRLVLTVADDGVGAPSAASLREGVGLGATRARLEQLYGGSFALFHGPRPGGGFEVVLRLPVDPPMGVDDGENRGEAE